MTISIALPDDIEAQLRRRAESDRRSVEELAVEILANSLVAENSFPTLEAVVERIRATPPNPLSYRPTTASLAEALLSAPEDPRFEAAGWNRQWDAVEAEMKAMTRKNDLAEGRG